MMAERNFQSKRRGVSTAEAIVATVVLTIAIACVGRFAAGVNRGLRERELATRIGWQIENARAEISAWGYGDITPANIQQRMAISESLTESLLMPQWQARVTVVQKPIPAKRIHLSLTCTYNEQISTPTSLTFWVPDPSGEAKTSDEASLTTDPGDDEEDSNGA